MYLNKIIKDKIKSNIEIFVKDKYAKSSAGRELSAMEKKLAKKIRKNHEVIFPLEDMRVLNTYELCRYDKKIRFAFNGDKLIFNPWGNNSKIQIIHFDPPLVSPQYSSISPDGLLTKDFKIFRKASYDIDCEIKEVVSAYMSRTHGFRTIEKFLEKHPDMKKFAPDEYLNPKPEEIKKVKTGDELIKQFEKD